MYAARSAAEVAVEAFAARHTGATSSPIAGGSFSVTVPGVALAPGWSKATTTIGFIVPTGFPMQRPDCFWADADLRLASGAMPSNTSFNAAFGFTGWLWFSYHPQDWDVRCSLETYFHLIQARLAEAR